MHFDILIFAIVAAILIYRLNAVLGTRHGEERRRSHPLAEDGTTTRDATPASKTGKEAPAQISFADTGDIVDPEANKDGRIETGLAEIAGVDGTFDLKSFMQGARYAFELIVTSYSKGDVKTLPPLVSPKLLADFTAGIKAREKAGHTAETIIHRIKSARVVAAHLGGTMAYITVDFDVEETTYTRDKDGNIVDGNPDRVFSVEDVWTFTRDLRTDDPNWMLIETKAVEK